jgi:hypothetical protein
VGAEITLPGPRPSHCAPNAGRILIAVPTTGEHCLARSVELHDIGRSGSVWELSHGNPRSVAGFERL